MARTLYRAVNHWPVVPEDFLSDEARGHAPRPAQIADPVLYIGVSVFDRLEEIEERRRRLPRFPRLTVALEIPEGASVAIHKTLGPGHYTIVGDPQTLMRYVVRLI